MKQFNLEEYLANSSRKVVTRDGRNVRIICIDKVSEKGYPLVALVMTDGHECVHTYNMYGQFYRDRTDDLDLFFAPEKHEGWTPVYRDPLRNIRFGYVYSTKKEAEEASKYDTRYVTIAKVEWEE